MPGSNEYRGRSRRLGAEDRGWSSTGRVLGGRSIERSGDSLCSLHHAQGDEERAFLGSASKPRWTGSPSLASKLMATVLVVRPQNHSLRFPGLCLKISGCDWLICPTKSPRWFLSLGLKTMWAMVCRLRHTTDGRMKMTQDMHRDLAAYFTWKRVGLGFPSLPQNFRGVMAGGARDIIMDVVLITCPNHDVSFTCKALITSAYVGGYDANPTNIVSSAMEFALSSLAAPSHE
jgi:hypothetical protein